MRSSGATTWNWSVSVGVYAHGADKVGVDAAELSGWPEPTGVTATNDIDALLVAALLLQPAVAEHRRADPAARVRRNVCSSAAWITGGKQSPEDLDRIRKACEKGNSTIFGSGAHPGMTNLVGMVLSGSCERVDEIRITESVDCSTYESAGTQTAMGFSQDPDTPGLAESVRRESEVFAESAAMMADAIDAKLDKITFDVTFTPATGDSDLGFMQIPQGTGVLRWLNNHGGNGTCGDVRREGCAGRDRKKYFGAALDRLVEAGSVVVVDDEIKLAVK